jgi:hypothetical protein
LSRAENANKRAFLRWEFARRSTHFKDRYSKLTSNNTDLIVSTPLLRSALEDFLREFCLFPLNPDFSFEELLNEKDKLKEEKEKGIKLSNQIYEKFLGKNSLEKKKSLAYYDFYKLKKDERSLVKIKHILGVNWKSAIQKIQSLDNKAREQIKRFRILEARDKYAYLNEAIHHLSALYLSNEYIPLAKGPTVVLNSYLKENHDISAFRFGSTIGLADDSVKEDVNPIIEIYEGDLTKVIMEVDLSYPTKEIVEDIKSEISLWKQIKRKFSDEKQIRQHFDDKEVQKMFRVFDMKSKDKNYSYIEIAKVVFGNHGADAIQKVRNMLNKVKKNANGGYKQIR